MENKLLFIIIGCSAVAGIIVLAFLIGCIIYRLRIRSLYTEANRDERFAGALLTQVFGEKIIKKPYVLRDDSVFSPKADAIFVCSGGVAVISVQKGGGLYSAPEQGQWRVIDNGEMRMIDNLLERQQAYVSEISAVLMKHSLRCPAIRGYVFATDDAAEIDYMSSDSVLTGSQLIEELKDFSAQKRLKASEQKEILDAIQKNSKNVRQTFLYRSQREVAVPATVKASEAAPEEEAFDLSDLILSARNESGDAETTKVSVTAKFRVVTDSEFEIEDETDSEIDIEEADDE